MKRPGLVAAAAAGAIGTAAVLAAATDDPGRDGPPLLRDAAQAPATCPPEGARCGAEDREPARVAAPRARPEAPARRGRLRRADRRARSSRTRAARVRDR